MNIYKIYASDLVSYAKNEEQILNLKNASAEDNYSIFGKYLSTILIYNLHLYLYEV